MEHAQMGYFILSDNNVYYPSQIEILLFTCLLQSTQDLNWIPNEPGTILSHAGRSSFYKVIRPTYFINYALKWGSLMKQTQAILEGFRQLKGDLH
jgi:hypothetical protein